MKLSKLLNSKNFLIILIFFTFFYQNLSANETVDIWNLEKEKNLNENDNDQINQNKDDKSDSIYQNQLNKEKLTDINQEENISLKKINIVGIYDPSENDLSMNMWVNSNGKKILEVAEKIQKLNLSKDATNILNIALLTNSNYPEKNINNDQFLQIKSDWLLKQKNLNLIETYLIKNINLKNSSNLIKYYLNYYLSKSSIPKACEIFSSINNSFNDNYISKFYIYCLINDEKKEEAQLQFDLLKENGFNDNFFENKFYFLLGLNEEPNIEISEKSLLDFHLSHRTNPNFEFEPKLNTSKLIWKYLSSSNLLVKANIIDLEDKEKIFTFERATHDKNYSEEELFSLYERFMFNINQLLSVEESYKNLPSSESRALLYQGILLKSGEPSQKLQLIKLLKDSFTKDNMSNAFDLKLTKFLQEIEKNDVPSNFENFYLKYLNSDISDTKKIKFNNKIIHQSKLLNYFNEESNKKKIQKDLENLLKKIKKNKKYFFSTKDLILLESLESDGIKIPKKYKNLYEKKDPNIPYDIQILIRKEEIGLFLLRLVEIVGEDEINDIEPETIYFIISALNQLNIDKLRNTIILKVLPLKI